MTFFFFCKWINKYISLSKYRRRVSCWCSRRKEERGISSSMHWLPSFKVCDGRYQASSKKGKKKKKRTLFESSELGYHRFSLLPRVRVVGIYRKQIWPGRKVPGYLIGKAISDIPSSSHPGGKLTPGIGSVSACMRGGYGHTTIWPS